MFRDYSLALIYAVASLIGAGVYGFLSGRSIGAAFAAVWICLVLGVLEVSLSFDNAVVNATILKDMSETWQRRFRTWGMLIAVVGMRLLFPVLIVSVTGRLNPLAAVQLAFQSPDRYAHIVANSHSTIMAFGGAFLALTGLKFFFDFEKDVHWLRWIEAPLQKFGRFEAFDIVFVLLTLSGVAALLTEPERAGFMLSGIFGIATFFAVDWLGEVLKAPEEGSASIVNAGIASFVYLEALDASFSFDGVIGAFAVSNNLVIIALGLGIGAMFIRSMTLSFVRSGLLSQFRYLEHGAFWAILSLAAAMFISVRYEIPDVVTALIGAGCIGSALAASIAHNRAHPLSDSTGSTVTPA